MDGRMKFLLLLWFTTLHAASLDPIQRAADANLAESARKAAFEEAVSTSKVPEVVAFARTADADARQRWVAIRVLGKVNSPPAVDALTALLADDQPAMRAAAVAALGDTRRPEVIEKIAARLQDPAMIVRGAAADALAVTGDPRAIPYLDRALADPSNSYRGSSLWVRRHYVEALSSIGTKSALDVIARNLTDPDPEVADAAIRAMEKAAGFSYASGRTREEQQAAWQRWWANQQ